MTPQMVAPSPAALRMRRARERRRRGDIIVNLQVPKPVISQLAALGWLDAKYGDEGEILTHAVAELVKQAIKLRVTPRASSHGRVIFLAEIPPSTVERLVDHGWVRRDHQHDSAAIATAYSRFAGGAIEVM